MSLCIPSLVKLKPPAKNATRISTPATVPLTAPEDIYPLYVLKSSMSEYVRLCAVVGSGSHGCGDMLWKNEDEEERTLKGLRSMSGMVSGLAKADVQGRIEARRAATEAHASGEAKLVEAVAVEGRKADAAIVAAQKARVVLKAAEEITSSTAIEAERLVNVRARARAVETSARVKAAAKEAASNAAAAAALTAASVNTQFTVLKLLAKEVFAGSKSLCPMMDDVIQLIEDRWNDTHESQSVTSVASVPAVTSSHGNSAGASPQDLAQIQCSTSAHSGSSGEMK